MEVPGTRGSNVPGRCRGSRFPSRPPMRRAATTRSEAMRGGKRERRQSTRVPHGALSVGRWAGCARRRGRKGRAAPCRRGGCREPRREPVPCRAGMKKSRPVERAASGVSVATEDVLGDCQGFGFGGFFREADKVPTVRPFKKVEQ